MCPKFKNLVFDITYKLNTDLEDSLGIFSSILFHIMEKKIKLKNKFVIMVNLNIDM